MTLGTEGVQVVLKHPSIGIRRTKCGGCFTHNLFDASTNMRRARLSKSRVDDGSEVHPRERQTMDDEDIARAWSGLSDRDRAGLRAATEDLLARIRSQGEQLTSNVAQAPRVFVHPVTVGPSIANRCWSRFGGAVHEGIGGVIRAAATPEAADRGPMVRAATSGLLDRVAVVLEVHQHLASVSTQDPQSGADPFRPVRQWLEASTRLAHILVHATRSGDDADMKAVVEMAEAAPNEFPQEQVATEIAAVTAHPSADAPRIGWGTASLTFDDVMAIPMTAPRQTHCLGAECARDFAFPVEDLASVGHQAVRLLCADDPILALLAARETYALATAALRLQAEDGARILAEFAYEQAIMILDAGHDEMDAASAWTTTGRAKHLVEAHSALLDAVLKPMLRTVLQLAGRRPATGAALATLVEAAGAAGREDGILVLDLIARSADVEVRNAQSHRNAFIEASGRIRLVSESKPVRFVSVQDLAFDHEMLRALLAGIETGLFFAAQYLAKSWHPRSRTMPQRALAYLLSVALAEAGIADPPEFEWFENSGGLIITVARFEDVEPAEAAVASILPLISEDSRPVMVELRVAVDTEPGRDADASP